MGHWASNKIEKREWHSYQMEWNSNSLDGLADLRAARRDTEERLWVGDLRASVPRVLAQKEALMVGIFVGLLLALLARLIQVLLVTA
jgi:hypothetical protein